ncbi:MAG TPA: FAD-dependent oxidoreductase [Lacunisphaera sp.]|nr:FAD-dependent oxidoreductase [Lacunisphaera sp.]
METNATADVVVIGAGVAGLTTACLLAREGREVMVLDDGPVGGGETGRTTAHLSCALDDGFVELERVHGREGARLAAGSHAAAIDWIERVVHEENIRCDFVRLDGYLFNPPGVPGGMPLAEELRAAHRAGVVDAELVMATPVPLSAAGPVLRFPRQAQIHPPKYLAGLAAMFRQAGGQLHPSTRVADLRGDVSLEIVTQNGAVVTCEHVVVATNAPINDRLVLAAKQAAYRTYVIAAGIPPGAVPPALYWDTLDPYHYVRVAHSLGGDRLIVGGEDHKTGQADDAELRYARLEAWARAHFPKMGPVQYRWSGQIIEPMDGLAHIGRYPRTDARIYVATGDSGHGMTHGTIAGLLLTDLIQGRPNPWASLYDPARLAPAAAANFVAENRNELVQYADWITPGEITRDQIGRNEGAVVREGILKVAAYRDSQRKLHACAAVCPHLGGIVRWNHGEQSFDCPVHGSRFDRRGGVINGPAIRGLEPLPDLPGKNP